MKQSSPHLLLLGWFRQVVCLGDSAVGKSSIWRCFNEPETFRGYAIPTVGSTARYDRL